MQQQERYTAKIREWARELGFDQVGVARAEKLDDDARRLERWLSLGRHGGMQYMERYFDLRVDPRLLVPGARSVITLLMNYYPPQEPPPASYRVARYAYGRDYHEVIREKLNTLLLRIRSEIGEVEGRGFVDSAPVLERSWAQRSGLGWIGKNGNLLVKDAGSWFFIATLITDLELRYEDPFARDYCGTCTRCIEACPTEAIGPDKEIAGDRCISYFTIELKEALIPAEFEGRYRDWIFGCDICQEVCPWNRFARPTEEPAFQPLPELLNMSTGDWEALSEEAFRKIFRQSPLRRAKYSGIRRNIRFLQQHRPANSGGPGSPSPQR